MKRIALLLLLTTCACSCGQSDAEWDNNLERLANERLAALIPACRDGVQYLVSEYGGAGSIIIPHLKPDGKPHTCKETVK